MPYALQLITLGLVGAVIGSFLNVVIHRLPVMIARDPPPSGSPDDGERYDLALPPSACPGCGHRLRPWENVPLLSYALLRGRCSACAAPIGWRYPVVEALAAAAGPLLTLHFGMTEQGLAATVFVWFAIAITAIDLRHLLIPDLLSLPLLWLGLLISTRNIFVASAPAIIGAAAGYLAFFVISRVGARVSGRAVMGGGDAKLFAAIGAWIGWSHLPEAAVIASLLGSVVGIALVLTGKQDRSQPVPFGPFLLAGGVAALLGGSLLSGVIFGYRAGY
jgi:leader peptidase (prepilin peptidase)/N-methyltransferase